MLFIVLCLLSGCNMSWGYPEATTENVNAEDLTDQ